MLTHVSFFSGIGGIDIAAERAGFKTVAMCEIDPFCQSVLRKNFPGVPIHDDISTFKSDSFAGRVDLVSGGFPCQDVSVAGRQQGIEASRSGLFRELLRCIRDLRPEFALLENVPGLIVGGGIATVLGEISEMGFDAIWGSPSAEAVGAPHKRERVLIVAYPSSKRYQMLEQEIADAYKNGGVDTSTESRWQLSELSTPTRGIGGVRKMPPPGIVRMADGVPTELDIARIKALGNAVCPQQVYPILKAIANTLRNSKAVAA